MFERIIQGSVKNGLMVVLLIAGIVGGGIWSLNRITIDAVPDITNNQVQVVTISPSLAPQEVEQFITYPVELAMNNLPYVTEIRSVSRYGLSVVTVVFEEDLPVLDARQYVTEQIDIAVEDIPEGMGTPGLMPITTGLGEVYQYTLEVEPEYEDRYDIRELRTIQDWIVKRQLAGIPGVVEIGTFGGELKQFEVSVDPSSLNALNITLADVWDALASNNLNAGGSYIEKGREAWFIRAEGLIKNESDIRAISVTAPDGTPIRLDAFAEIREGSAPRFGAMTIDGEGEAVGGIVLMLKGENAYAVTQRIEERVASIQDILPDGVTIEPYLDRADLVGRTIRTVTTNLIEGGLIVILVLIFLLGNWRAGLIVASVIPLSMLFALICMDIFGVSANLMSLGAIDFGIVVDGAVIIVESVLFHMHGKTFKNNLERRDLVIDSSSRIYKSAAFGVLIILVVFLPVLSLEGVEGRMFRPMAQTVSFALVGALILSLTYVPWISYVVLKKGDQEETFSDRMVNRLKRWYTSSLNKALDKPKTVIASALAVLAISIFGFTQLGSVFIPTLEEGDLAMQVSMRTGTNLSEVIHTTGKAERILLDQFPEVKHVVSKIGTAEIPTDPMPMEAADVMILMKPKSEWTSADTREELVEQMEEALASVQGASFEFTQPIQLRFNELLSGSKADLAVKIYGEDLDTLAVYAERISHLFEGVEGAADVKVEATQGMRFERIVPDRSLLAFHGVSMEEVTRLIEFAYAGGVAGTVYEGERRFELVVRLREEARKSANLNDIFVSSAHGHSIPLSALVQVDNVEGPSQISRDKSMRRIAIGVNVRGRDVAGIVEDIQAIFKNEIDLPPGYRVEYGGDFENLQRATARLQTAVPVALILILILLFAAFGSVKHALLIFSAVPLSAIGGIAALWIRGMPFSISAGIGFIALFGVAVLNGIVMVSHLNDLKMKGSMSLRDVVLRGGADRLRPVIMTAAVAALGFLPMAISTSAGAEVQKPLATVVIGGLISATLLTLIILPVLYQWLYRRVKVNGKVMAISLILGLSTTTQAQSILTMDNAVEMGLENHPALAQASGNISQAEAESSASIDLAPTEFTLQYGQINAQNQDYNFAVQQDIGSILSHLRRGQSSAALIRMREAEFIVEQKKMKLLIEQAYVDWTWAWRQWNVLREQDTIIQSFQSRIETRIELGESRPSEALQAQARLIEYRRRIADAHVSYLAFERALFTLIGAREPFVPDESASEIIARPVNVSASVDSALVLSLLERVNYREAEVREATGEFFPSFNIGYFNQMLEGVPGFQGFQVGMSYPLWFARSRADVQQAQVEAEIAQTEASFRQREFNTSLDYARRIEAVRSAQWKAYADQQSKNADALLNAALVEWHTGEIDFFQFFQLFEMVVNLEMNYLNTVREYNTAILQLEFIQQ